MEAVCVPPRLIFPSGFFLVGRAFCLLPVWRAQCFSGWDACRAPWSVLGFVVAMTMHLNTGTCPWPLASCPDPGSGEHEAQARPRSRLQKAGSGATVTLWRLQGCGRHVGLRGPWPFHLLVFS